MDIRGAIFDCDGTLLDSMPMWTLECVGLLERYGVPDALRVFLEHESLDMDEKCRWYHENLGIGQSWEQLFRELWDNVAHAYATQVRPFPGCERLLSSLASRGVPMVIASATPRELLHEALSAHGLDGYFDELVFAGDVGRGKEHPDVYLAARKRLKTPIRQTWVFEDAPFGVRSAARAGFPTVAIVNDHDGRDRTLLDRWATVVSNGYADLTPEVLESRMLHALVVGGSPEVPSKKLLRDLAETSDYVVAADAGASSLKAAGIVPQAFCGDADSCGDDVYDWVRQTVEHTELYPREKDETDLVLAIKHAQREAADRKAKLRLTFTGISGGRPDHFLGVWGVLASCRQDAPSIAEDGYSCRVLSSEGDDSWYLEDCVGSTVSLVALSSDTVASARGMHWNLDHAPLVPLGDMGVSNVVDEALAELRCHAGLLAVFLLADGK
jgi:thiamine pyrophosphokinase